MEIVPPEVIDLDSPPVLTREDRVGTPPPTSVGFQDAPPTPGKAIGVMTHVPKDTAARIQKRAAASTAPGSVAAETAAPLAPAGGNAPPEGGAAGPVPMPDVEAVPATPTPEPAELTTPTERRASADTTVAEPSREVIRPRASEYWAGIKPYLRRMWKLDARAPGFVKALQATLLQPHQYPIGTRVIIPQIPRPEATPRRPHHSRKRKSSSSSTTSSSSSSESSSDTSSSSSSSSTVEEKRRSRRARKRSQRRRGSGRIGAKEARQGPTKAIPPAPQAREDVDEVLVLHPSDADTIGSGSAPPKDVVAPSRVVAAPEAVVPATPTPARAPSAAR
ncbi:trinucleotide repeat-containing gene 18 protein-like, partial [Fopius arisanus]|uniref:Trinucleotide repeat-containing gene 18 protein-like n=1 Tax=Fopius arisanus TaxID=64838 RepID=A0A9R1TQB0_9HYME